MTALGMATAAAGGGATVVLMTGAAIAREGMARLRELTPPGATVCVGIVSPSAPDKAPAESPDSISKTSGEKISAR